MLNRHTALNAFSTEFGRQMRFILGPRQCGKTTLAKEQLKSQGCESLYYNWDERLTRDRYKLDSRFFAQDMYGCSSTAGRRWVVMDEIHKYPRWKNLLKDFFDTFEKDALFIVTGSARLDLLRRAGDSLAGRYFTFRLNPFTLREVLGTKAPLPAPENAEHYVEAALSKKPSAPDAFQQLFDFSGFPEPFITASTRFHNKWRADYSERLLREDLRELTVIREIENLATLLTLLPARIGSPLSINALSEDLKCGFSTIANYLQVLEKVCLIFRILPYSARIARALTKETKLYFFDWTRLEGDGPRFENYVAMELKSLTEHWTDSGDAQFDMRYVRTRDGKESDFLVLRDRAPWLMLEAKLSRSAIEGHHLRHRVRLGDIPFVQIVREENVAEKREAGVYQISASRFFGV